LGERENQELLFFKLVLVAGSFFSFLFFQLQLAALASIHQSSPPGAEKPPPVASPAEPKPLPAPPGAEKPPPEKDPAWPKPLEGPLSSLLNEPL
jgi:hypothetical protein